jgi:hypothetical protein
VLLITEEIEEDLEPIALEWQAAGLALWRTSARRAAAPFTLRAPWFGLRLWKALFRSAFQPAADGAYGAMIEEPSVS